MGPNFSELLVTSSAEGTSAPPVGSVYEINNMAGGFENVYSDIAPTTPGGPDTLSDTLVTPFGNIPITTDLHAFLDPTDSFFPYGPTDPLAVDLRRGHHRLRSHPTLRFLRVRAGCVGTDNDHRGIWTHRGSWIPAFF